MSEAVPVIGLEIHVQLKTETKLFCGDASVADAGPNTHVCPVCLGLPGALPVLNAHAVELGVRAAAGLGCELHRISRFDRKSYFYPDLPKGFQITQYAAPFATGGALVTQTGARIRIRRIHLEEDAGKLLHDRLAGRTAVDMNRAGVPLLEIVTEPDLASPQEARAFLKLLRQTLQYLAVSDCEMEKGSLRVDANVSLVAARGAPADPARTELKNLNSFAAIERALHAEIARQREALAAGHAVSGDTLAWNDVTSELHVMRAKQQSAEYRYLQEPDLPPLELEASMIDAICATLPELPLDRAARLERQYGLRTPEADVLCASRALADYFERLVALTGAAHVAAAWTIREVLSVSDPLHALFPVSPERLGELIALVEAGNVTSTAARVIFRRMCETERAAGDIAHDEGLAAVAAGMEAEAWAREVVHAHPRELERLRDGEARILEFFMGELMRKSGGRLDPRRARALIERLTQGE